MRNSVSEFVTRQSGSLRCPDCAPRLRFAGRVRQASGAAPARRCDPTQARDGVRLRRAGGLTPIRSYFGFGSGTGTWRFFSISIFPRHCARNFL